MTETAEELKAKARALRNKPSVNKNPLFGKDEHSRRGEKSQKPQTGVKSNFRKPSV